MTSSQEDCVMPIEKVSYWWYAICRGLIDIGFGGEFRVSFRRCVFVGLVGIDRVLY